MPLVASLVARRIASRINATLLGAFGQLSGVLVRDKDRAFLINLEMIPRIYQRQVGRKQFQAPSMPAAYVCFRDAVASSSNTLRYARHSEINGADLQKIQPGCVPTTSPGWQPASVDRGRQSSFDSEAVSRCNSIRQSPQQLAAGSRRSRESRALTLNFIGVEKGAAGVDGWQQAARKRRLPGAICACDDYSVWQTASPNLASSALLNAPCITTSSNGQRCSGSFSRAIAWPCGVACAARIHAAATRSTSCGGASALRASSVSSACSQHS